jgi:hypothetical protein
MAQLMQSSLFIRGHPFPDARLTKESLMLKLSALIGSLAFFCSSWFSGFSVPRLMQGPGDYLVMPLLGYIMIILAAQVAARFVPEQAQ